MKINQIDLFLDKEKERLIENNIIVLKLTNEVSYTEETIKAFRELVNESESFYPGIDLWYKKKVSPGIKNGERYAFLAIVNGVAIGEAIVKKGRRTKLCSMRICEEYQNKGIGNILFYEIAKMLGINSESIYFTAPEQLAIEREGLFKNLSFENIGYASKFYRPSEDEFVFKASAIEFKKSITNWILQKRLNSIIQEVDPRSIVLSIRPRFAHQIMAEKKRVELRRKFPKNLIGSTIFIYSTKPDQAILGEAVIRDIKDDIPMIIWDQYQQFIGCTLTEFQSYCNGVEKVNALFLDNIKQYKEPLPWSAFSTTYDAPRNPPQNYFFVSSNSYRLIQENY